MAGAAGIRPADGLVPIVAERRCVNLAPACGLPSICYAFASMSTRPLEEAMERAERALLRIERAIERGSMHKGGDDKLRTHVADAIAELDAIIKDAAR